MNLSKINPLGHLEQKHRTYRTIWISDIHLGSKGSQSEHLLEFLKYNDSEYLYLVGDIIDGWRLTKKWYWPQSHNDVIQKILRKARKGTKVFYIPGNHDEGSRSFIGLTFGDIKIRNQAFHLTAKEKKLWVVHGDMFDHVIQHARWLAYIGDSAYTFLLWINKWFNDLRRFFNLPYWSLSQYLKLKVKKAVSFINAFETLMVKEAHRRGCDGVVCGHIHKSELKEINNLIYANDGDWVESLTALVEHKDGELEIVNWVDLGHEYNLNQSFLKNKQIA
ncbi:MAG: UDP-2,3-diacylglucosamine diphosphatase [Candidatus Puniceispirillales bacterium]|jgi:UDP-2,3-diacylglucosamine pyrophosphatase LpxH|nr:UDP-2,3-diacylglucosamine diphosphatase [Pseudomonadota bacterium]